MWCTERPRRTARPARGVPWRPGSDDDTRSWAMGELLARVSRRATRAQVHHVTPVLADRAGGLVAEVYRQVERDFGMLAPPVALHAPAPETLAASWVILRETLLAAGRTSRAAREMVAAVVSLGNTCPYCVEVHATLLGGLVRGSLARSVAEGRLESVRDPALRAVAEWARDSATRPGPEPSPLSVPSEHGAELVGVAVTFQYLNRMVNIFLDRSPIPAAVPRAVRAGLRPLIGRLMAPNARRDRVPGSALDLLPAAPLPDEWSWTAGHPPLAAAFGRAVTVAEAAGGRSVPPAVRELVLARLSTWDGQATGASTAWVEDGVARLGVDERPAGRLALLTAFASYQVSPSVIAAFRYRSPQDSSLIELTSWASLMAAGKIGSWMARNLGTLGEAPHLA